MPAVMTILGVRNIYLVQYNNSNKSLSVAITVASIRMSQDRGNVTGNIGGNMRGNLRGYLRGNMRTAVKRSKEHQHCYLYY